MYKIPHEDLVALKTALDLDTLPLDVEREYYERCRLRNRIPGAPGGTLGWHALVDMLRFLNKSAPFDHWQEPTHIDWRDIQDGRGVIVTQPKTSPMPAIFAGTGGPGWLEIRCPGMKPELQSIPQKYVKLAPEYHPRGPMGTTANLRRGTEVIVHIDSDSPAYTTKRGKVVGVGKKVTIELEDGERERFDFRQLEIAQGNSREPDENSGHENTDSADLSADLMETSHAV